MSAVDDIRTQVRGILSDFVEDELASDSEGRLSFRFDSAQVYVDVKPLQPSSTVVRIVAPMSFGVPPSEELFRWVATHGAYDYGHIRAVIKPRGVDLEFRHSLLGDHLDAEELAQAVTSVATTADELDDEVKDVFGGTRFHEDSGWAEPLD